MGSIVARCYAHYLMKYQENQILINEIGRVNMLYIWKQTVIAEDICVDDGREVCVCRVYDIKYENNISSDIRRCTVNKISLSVMLTTKT